MVHDSGLDKGLVKLMAYIKKINKTCLKGLIVGRLILIYFKGAKTMQSHRKDLNHHRVNIQPVNKDTG